MNRTDIPEKINNFNIYNGGNKLLGVSGEITLPDFETASETISGPGILGEIDSPSVGMFNDMEFEIPFRTLYGDIYDLSNPLITNTLNLRGSIQVRDRTGNIKFVGMRVVVKGTSKKTSGGKVAMGSPMDSSVTLGLTYIKIEIDNQPKIEIDKLNSVYKINGVDILRTVRSQC